MATKLRIHSVCSRPAITTQSVITHESAPVQILLVNIQVRTAADQLLTSGGRPETRLLRNTLFYRETALRKHCSRDTTALGSEPKDMLKRYLMWYNGVLYRRY